MELILSMINFLKSNQFLGPFFGALFGALFAFLLNYLKERHVKKENKIKCLAETKFILSKHILHIKDIQEKYKNMAKNSPYPELPPRINKKARSCKYGFYHYKSKLIDINLNSLNFLINDNEKLYESILLAVHKFDDIPWLIEKRNNDLSKLVIPDQLNLTETEWNMLIAYNEEKMYWITAQVLKSLWHAREDCKKAHEQLSKYLSEKN